MFWLIFLVFLAACFAAGTTGAMFPPGDWYRRLEKPSWTPPDWVFPVAWTTLYIFIAFAGARVAVRPDAGLALALWSLQIALNALWTPAFFGKQNIRMGMLVVLALWGAVFCAMLALWSVDWIAGALFIPYLVWVTIASALNAAVWRLNPGEARATA